MGDDDPAAKKAKPDAGAEGADAAQASAPSASARFHCDYCTRDITASSRVKCAVCPDFDLCLPCFSSGVEITPHKNSHKYRIVEHMNFPILHSKWGADEELLLLEAIELYGLGNWVDVAEHVGGKTRFECERHYFSQYINSKKKPIPDFSHFKPGEFNPNEEVEDAPSNVYTETAPSKKDAKSKDQSKSGQPTPAELAGWYPKRNDFETEFDNDAELILADMEFKEDDTPEEIELKLKILDIYNSKLDERAQRKRFLSERGILDYKKHNGIERKRTREEREIGNQLRIFARFHPQEEHEEFVEGVILEQRLRARIRQLQKHREAGIKSLAEGDQYEQEKRKRDTDMALKKSREAAPYLFPGRTTQRSSKWLNRDASGGDMLMGSLKGKDGGKSRKPGAPLDLTDVESVELLSMKEREICSILRIFPVQYLTIKELLVRESFRQGFLKKRAARNLVKIDVNKTGKLYDFFLENGWIKSEGEAGGGSNGTASSAPVIPAPEGQP